MVGNGISPVLRRENNCGEHDEQSGAVQLSFELFGHAFRNTKDGPGGDHFALLAVPSFAVVILRPTAWLSMLVRVSSVFAGLCTPSASTWKRIRGQVENAHQGSFRITGTPEVISSPVGYTHLVSA